MTQPDDTAVDETLDGERFELLPRLSSALAWSMVSWRDGAEAVTTDTRKHAD